MDCLYNGCSRNFNRKCHLKGGHEGNHKCEINNHLCLENCKYKGISNHCNDFCKYDLETEPNHKNHICDVRTENHGCPGICHLFRISKECTKNCKFIVGHKGEHLCNITKHCCNQKCNLKDNSRNCQDFCQEYVENNNKNQEHICNDKCIYLKIIKSFCAH